MIHVKINRCRKTRPTVHKKCEYITVVAPLLQRREFYHYEAEKENAWKLIHLEISLYSLGTPPSYIDKVDH